MSTSDMLEAKDEIAVIGMAGRFPGARNVDEFWRNLRDGREMVSFFSDKELEEAGVDRATLQDPRYVKARAIVADVEMFDASRFGYAPREAEMLDPQHRFFLECAWEALENAAYDPDAYQGRIGVFGGSSISTYFLYHLFSNPAFQRSADADLAIFGNDKDFLTTRVSYKLGLRGPSVVIQTACSTSLVATHLACQSLLTDECDIALAGGVSLSLPQKRGYFADEGGLGSPDGHCRAFDAKAHGTVGGNGVGIVVLKRLEEALADGDTIYAVIKGSAINNDGSLKVGYTAPSVDGQARVIADALSIAEVHPESITYIETHGTGTPLGDPIEIAALTKVFRAFTDKTGYCAIGSLKTNIGHLDAAAGVASLMKTILMLQHRMIPPSLHFEQPNPEIDFANSPFYVNTRLREWTSGSTPRRAGVTSLGIGGTNAHIIIEEAPPVAPTSARSWHTLMLSGRTERALDLVTTNLAEFLRQHPESNLADVAYTLNVGRRSLNHRRLVLCQSRDDAIQALETQPPLQTMTNVCGSGEPPVIFLFPGLGDQYVNMGLHLYQSEPVFRTHLDQCAEILRPLLGLDVREALYPGWPEMDRPLSQTVELSLRPYANANLFRLLQNPPPADEATQRLMQTSLSQPILFMVEYALARLWMEWGIQPQAMIGYSVGEYVAACIAGVLSLHDALTLVAKRAQYIQELPAGRMVAVPLCEKDVQGWLRENLWLSAVNGPSLCVVSGTPEAVEHLEQELAERGIVSRRLQTTHAFHSAMMEPIAPAFRALACSFEFRPPQIPYVSNVTGTWITASQATDPAYWVSHLCQTIRLADGLHAVGEIPERVLLEVGPGQTLSSLAAQYLAGQESAENMILPSMRRAYDPQPDTLFLQKTLGQIWLAGAAINWPAVYTNQQRQRLPLPPTPFEHQRYWIEPAWNPSALLSSDEYADQPEAGQETPDLAVAEGRYARPDLPIGYVAPSNETEQKIAEVWQEILGVKQVGVNDNFFDLGGHSLAATRIVSRLQDMFQITIPLQRLLEAVTVGDLSLIVEELILEDLERLSQEM